MWHVRLAGRGFVEGEAHGIRHPTDADGDEQVSLVDAACGGHLRDPSGDVRHSEQVGDVGRHRDVAGDLDGGRAATREGEVEVVGTLPRPDVVGTHGSARHPLEETGRSTLVGAQAVEAARVPTHRCRLPAGFRWSCSPLSAADASA